MHVVLPNRCALLGVMRRRCQPSIRRPLSCSASSLSTTCMVCVKVHTRPSGSRARYWRSPWKWSVGSSRISAPAARACSQCTQICHGPRAPIECFRRGLFTGCFTLPKPKSCITAFHPLQTGPVRTSLRKWPTDRTISERLLWPQSRCVRPWPYERERDERFQPPGGRH